MHNICKTDVKMQSGLQSFFVMDCLKLVIFLTEIKGNFGNLFAIVGVSLRNVQDKLIASKRYWREPNITLGSVVSDVLGVSAREMLDAIAECEEDPTKLANFARRTMKKKKDELELVLKGYIHSHQRLMLKTILSESIALSPTFVSLFYLFIFSSC